MVDDTKTYKSIGEVAKQLNLVNKKNGSLSTHTIRYWETEFKQIKPKIFAGKRRYYDNENIKILGKIKFLLKDKGMTIKGVKKFLNNPDTLKLDEIEEKHISSVLINKNKILTKVKKINKIIKGLKDI